MIKGRLTPNRLFVFFASMVLLSLFLKSGVLSLATLLLFLFCITYSNRQIKEVLSGKEVLLLPIFLFLFYIVSTSYSSNFKEAINLIIRRAPIFLLPLGFILLKIKPAKKDLDLTLMVFVAACFVSSLVCYGYAIYNIIKFQSFILPTDREYSYFFTYDALTRSINFDPIYLSIFCSFATAICLNTPLLKNPTWKAGLVCYFIIFIILIAAKIGIITLFVILFYWWLYKPGKIKSLLISFLVVGITVWIGVYKFPFLKERFMITTNIDYSEVDSGRWGSIAFRIAIWSCAFEAIEKRPLLGYGTGGGQHALESVYAEKKFVRGTTDSYNSHNEFLSTTLDMGLLGLTLFCLMLFIPTFLFLKSKDSLGVSFVVIVGLTFLVESVFFRQKGITFFAFFYSFLAWRHYLSKIDESPAVID